MYCVAQQVENGILAYRPAIEGNELHTYNIGSNMEEYIYKAKVFRCVFAFVYVHYCKYTYQYNSI